MGFLTRIIRRFATDSDRRILDEAPTRMNHLRVIGRTVLRNGFWYMGLLVAILAFVMASAMDVYHRTESPQFCATCHEMNTNMASWEVSRHGDIKCVDCHARPGIGGYLAAKLGGLRQMYIHVTSASIKDISMGDDANRIVSENCLRCHPGASRVEERDGIAISHKEHMKKGVRCVDCHSGRFAHPEAKDAAVQAAAVAGKKPAVFALSTHADCFGCHDGTHKIGDAVAFDARAEGSCEKCHLDSVSVYWHGGKSWAEEDRKCLSCHDPRADTHFALRGQGETELCAKCHEKLKGVQFASAHRPFAEGKCDDCHRVMSPLHLFGNAPRPTSAFCVSCHQDIGLRLQGKPADKLAHFVKGKKDLHRKHASVLDGEDWCGNCHGGHGSDAGRAMIRLHDDSGNVDATAKFVAEEKGGSCTGSCHQDAEEYEWAAPPARPEVGAAR